MKKIIVIVITTFVLFNFSIKEVHSANSFRCVVNASTSTCEVQPQCDPGYLPILMDNTQCSDHFPISCPTGLDHPCAAMNGAGCIPNAIVGCPDIATYAQCNPNGVGTFLHPCPADKPICEVIGGQNSAHCVAGQLPGGGNGGTGPGAPVIDLSQIMTRKNFPGFKFVDAKLGTIVSSLLPLLYTIAGIALLIYMIMAGFKFLTSAGDAKKTESAKSALTAALIGFIIIVVAYFLTQLVNTIFHLGTGI